MLLHQSLQVLLRGMKVYVQPFVKAVQRLHSVRAGQPVQVIHAGGACPWPTIDLSGLAISQREVVVGMLAKEESRQPCSLEEGPLLRTWLLQLDRSDYVFLWTLHHIISDGWSMKVFYHELKVLYQAFSSGQPSPLAPLLIQYGDFAVWQRQWLQGEFQSDS